MGFHLNSNKQGTGSNSGNPGPNFGVDQLDPGCSVIRLAFGLSVQPDPDTIAQL